MGVKGKTAAEAWLESAAEAYEGEDTEKLLNRAMRFHATVDGLVMHYAELRLLERIAAALERVAPKDPGT